VGFDSEPDGNFAGARGVEVSHEIVRAGLAVIAFTFVVTTAGKSSPKP
jgi:hypothetical protein